MTGGRTSGFRWEARDISCFWGLPLCGICWVAGSRGEERLETPEHTARARGQVLGENHRPGEKAHLEELEKTLQAQSTGSLWRGTQAKLGFEQVLKMQNS